MTAIPSRSSPVPGLSIREAASRLGASVHTLRYYEREGLLSVPRLESTQRRYGPADLELLRFLLALRATGMPMVLIRRCTDWLQFLASSEMRCTSHPSPPARTCCHSLRSVKPGRFNAIRCYMALVRLGEATVSERRDLLLEHQRAVVAQIAALQGNLSAIDHKIEKYDRMGGCAPRGAN